MNRFQLHVLAGALPRRLAGSSKMSSLAGTSRSREAASVIW